MNYKLFLDDIRHPADNSWFVARSFETAKFLVMEFGFPIEISYDHDLGDNVPSGKDFANWLIEYDLDTNLMPKNFQYYVHSANPAGAANIRGIMDGYLKFKNK